MMANHVYVINKGINRPLEFKGIRAQYIMYLAAGLVILFILFAIIYIAGVPPYVCLAVIGVAGTVLFTWISRLSHKYGQHGLMKEAGFRQVPTAITCRSRKVFLSLRSSKTSKVP